MEKSCNLSIYQNILLQNANIQVVTDFLYAFVYVKEVVTAKLYFKKLYLTSLENKSPNFGTMKSINMHTKTILGCPSTS